MPRTYVYLAFALAPACGGSGQPSAEGNASALDDPYPAPTVSDEGEPIAKVGPVVFTTGEMERRLAEASPFLRQRLADPAELRTWVENELRAEAIAQEAWKDGLQKTPEVKAAFRKLLIKAFTERALKKFGSLEPNDKELIEAYRARDAEFNQPAKVRLSQIVIYVDSKKERADARKLLERIRGEVIEGQKRNDHTVFAKAVRKYTQDDTTKLAAGDLQFLTREALTKRYGEEVATVCFDEATVGDLFVAGAPNAVVLFKKTGYRRAVERSFEEVRSQLRLLLTQERRKEAIEAWSRDLMEIADIDLNEEALSRIEVPRSTPPAGGSEEE